MGYILHQVSQMISEKVLYPKDYIR